jgi:hypothetical protein
VHSGIAQQQQQQQQQQQEEEDKKQQQQQQQQQQEDEDKKQQQQQQEDEDKKQQQQQDKEERQQALASSSRMQVETAGLMLASLLGCCEGCVPPPPYEHLAPALYVALQQRALCSPALAGSAFIHHAGRMVRDQQLQGLVLDAVGQGQGPGASLLALLPSKVLQALEPTHPAYQLVHARLTALLAGGTAAGATFLAAALQQGGTLWQVQGMVEAACNGLLAASRAAAALDASTSSSSSSRDTSGEFPCLVALPPSHTVLLRYLRGLVGVVLHLATTVGPDLSSSLMGLGGPLVPGLAEALSLLLESPQLPGSSMCGHGQRPYHDAVWAALLALSECPGTGPLVAALLQHRPGLLQALAASWDQTKDLYEEPADNAARLAACLLLSGSIPGQEQRQQQEQLMAAALRVWDRVSPSFWRGWTGLLMELIRLPHGPKAVAAMPGLLDTIFVYPTEEAVLGPDQVAEAWALLLAAPDFTSWLMEGLQRGEEACFEVVGSVLGVEYSERTQQLLALPGLGDALAQTCNDKDHWHPADWLPGDALLYGQLQEYLAQQPRLFHALVARLFRGVGNVYYFWDCLQDEDRGDGWLVQQPLLLDYVVRDLVVGNSCRWAGRVVKRLLDAGSSAVCESLLRQPHVLRALLQALGRRCRQQQPPDDASTDQQDWQRVLLQELAASEQAPQALALLLGLLARDDAELSAGVFGAMHLFQMHMDTGSRSWCQELAATCSRGADILHSEGQLQALRQGVEQVQGATAAAAAAMQQLEEQRLTAAAAVVAGEYLPGCSAARRRGNRRLSSHSTRGVQQQGQPGGGLHSAATAHQEGRSSQRKGRGREAAGEQAVAGAGSKRRAGGRQVPGKALPAEAAAAAGRVAADLPDGDGGKGAGAPHAAAAKRTRR